jgi:hypothetical protein
VNDLRPTRWKEEEENVTSDSLTCRDAGEIGALPEQMSLRTPADASCVPADMHEIVHAFGD